VNALATLLGRATYEALTVIAQHPALALPLARRRGFGVPVDRHTELVIEGFPRSGTSFAVAAFLRAQGRPVRVSHHVHAPANLIEAVRLRVPALLVVRHPEGAVVDWCLSKSALTLPQGLRGWIRFHDPVLPISPRIVVATDEQVRTRFDEVVREVNTRFGTEFVEPVLSPERAREAEEEAARDRERLGGRGPSVLGGPSDDPTWDRMALLREYRSEELIRLRRWAERLFEFLTNPP
jgi:hypothetical protein